MSVILKTYNLCKIFANHEYIKQCDMAPSLHGNRLTLLKTATFIFQRTVRCHIRPFCSVCANIKHTFNVKHKLK